MPTVTTKPLDLRRVYIFPTRHGFLFAAVLLLILLGAINYDNALAYLLCFLLGGLFLVAMLHTYRNLAGLALLSARAEPIFMGNNALFEIGLTGFPHYRRCRLELARVHAHRQFWWRRNRVLETCTVPDLTHDATVVMKIPAPQRGYLQIGRLRIRSTFPLGILQAWAYLETDARCVVYPTPRGNLNFPRWSVTGESDVGHQPGVDEFAELAPYRAGDSLRSIHWPLLAKRDEVLVKRFTGNGVGDVWLQWQAVASYPDLESRLSQLAKWVVDAEAAGLGYGLELPTTKFPIAGGAQHAASLLRALALFETEYG